MCFVRITIIFFFLINVNNISLATSGTGELKFSSASFNNFLAYMRGDGNPSGEVGKKKGTPLAFAINEKGNYSYYFYCPMKFGDNCYPSHMEAMNRCSKASKSRGTGRCYVFAKARKIVWDSKNIKLRRKFDEQGIRKIFQENNWYGALTDQSSNTEKKDTKTKITKKKSTDNVDIVKELKELNSLLESGVISAKEFEKAKKKLLE
jgi:hypothetical protein